MNLFAHFRRAPSPSVVQRRQVQHLPPLPPLMDIYAIRASYRRFQDAAEDRGDFRTMGYYAFHLEEEKTACPYLAGTPEAAQWLAGWTDADRENR